MNKLGIVERDGKTVGYLVRSPATGALLLFYTNPEFSPCVWTFNGDMERPTFSPSMLLHPDNIHGREHFFVRAGKIEYLQDCDHPMAGMTVDMVDVDGEEVDP
ncbi:MAG: hypothetical protein MSK39_00585 [Dysosmobacter sp.]|nr:hypothetical protein [Dysosmobacter sp.]